MPKESESREFIESYRNQFGQYEDFLELIFDEPIDYLDPQRKEDILAILEWPIVNLLIFFFLNFKTQKRTIHWSNFNLINFIQTIQKKVGFI